MKKVPLLLQHDPRRVIGEISLTEEGEKLFKHNIIIDDNFLKVAAGGNVLKSKIVNGIKIIEEFEIVEISIFQ